MKIDDNIDVHRLGPFNGFHDQALSEPRAVRASSAKAGATGGTAESVEGALKGDVDLSQGADGKNGENSDGLNGGGAGSDEDSDLANANATAEDPSDYFKRIDKSASIFKIVSARYMKKKGLWNQPAKPQDQLKPKKI